MTTDKSEEQELGLTTRRIESLTDGVFAIAMTLLVLSLELPPLGQQLSGTQLQQLLLSQAAKFFNYALSFVLLAVFWIIHHQQFHYIKRTNRTHLWINILVLMFVALMPFSTSLIGDFPGDWIAELFFSANLFIVGLLFQLNWLYVTWFKHLTDRSLTPRLVALGLRRGLVTPAVALVAIVLSLIDAPLTTHIYILIPVILLLPMFRR
ncbi:MAG: DUF1211 domain-containing protein [Candidatus Margulisbacteria bacterium]|nr:DUF1211 domain-containing protein [Candidatus Margulisiibacteriota bacterium]